MEILSIYYSPFKVEKILNMKESLFIQFSNPNEVLYIMERINRNINRKHSFL